MEKNEKTDQSGNSMMSAKIQFFSGAAEIVIQLQIVAKSPKKTIHLKVVSSAEEIGSNF